MNLAYMPPPPCGLSPQTDGMAVILKERAASSGGPLFPIILSIQILFIQQYSLLQRRYQHLKHPRPASDTPRWLSKFPVESNSNYILWTLNQ